MEEKILTEQELETVTETLANAAKENKDTQAIRAVVDSEEESILDEVDQMPLELDESEETLVQYGGISSEDVSIILDIKARMDAGEKFSVFNAMPESFKTKIKEEAYKMGMLGNKQFLNLMARSAIDTLISEANLDKEFQAFQNEMAKLTNIPSMTDAYLDSLRDTMEEKLLANAEQKKAEGDMEKYAEITAVSNAFTEAYSFRKQVNYLVSTSNILNVLAKHIHKPDKLKRLMEDFDFTLSKSKLKTKQTMKEAYEAMLSLNLDTETDYKELCSHFMVITCLVCRNMKYDNIVDMTFMYYTLTILNALKYTNNSFGLSKEVLENIKGFDEQVSIHFKKETEV